jgi:hypothetical protein
VDAIGTFIFNINEKDLEEVISRVMAKLKGIATHKGSDPAIAFEQFVEEVRAALATIVISPLLDRMEGFFERTENKPVGHTIRKPEPILEPTANVIPAPERREASATIHWCMWRQF